MLYSTTAGHKSIIIYVYTTPTQQNIPFIHGYHVERVILTTAEVTPAPRSYPVLRYITVHLFRYLEKVSFPIGRWRDIVENVACFCESSSHIRSTKSS